jgi:peptide/nickel transport system substrate-binding protein
MKRRHFLAAAGAAATLGMPSISRAAREQTLTFVPLINLVVLDPVASGFRGTHNHGYLVYDTLYGLDEKFVARPQMVEATSVENNGTLWTLRLREGLKFHDGQSVLARDAVASIRRFAARDMLGRSLIAVTSDLSWPDDRTIQFKLRRPFPHLATALAGSATAMPCIMPERLAVMDPLKPVPETIGSGPFRFVPGEFVAGERAVYERFTGYVSRTNEPQSYTAGPKIAHFDRVQWQAINDGATAAAALLRGEVDWIESPSADLVPMLARSQDVIVEVKETSGSIGIMRFNQLYPPFDNPAVRRALLGAIDQADIMTAVAGPDRSLWRDRIGLFGPTSPLVTEAGIDVLTCPRDYQKVKQQLSVAGYRGEKIVVASSEIGFLPAITHVVVDQLKRAGMNVDLQFTDLATLIP